MTTVPASLLRDLKRYAANEVDGDMAVYLLWLDPSVEIDANPVARARSLAWVLRSLTKREARAAEAAVEAEEYPSDADSLSALRVSAHHLEQAAALQVRGARVIRALLRATGGAA